MKFCVCEWSEATVVLMTESGHVLSYFNSIGDALEACSEWYKSNQGERKYTVDVRYKDKRKKPAQYAAVA